MADDPRIAAFARTNRRRQAAISLILGIIVTAGCSIALYVTLAGHTDLANSKGLREGGGYQLVLLLGGGGVVGLALLGRAIQLYRAKPGR